MMKPGTYKLFSTVKNPTPDRRVKRDWRAVTQWKEDSVWIIEVDTMITEMSKKNLVECGIDLATIPEDSYTRTTMRPADGGFAHYAVYDNSEIFQAIAPNLEAISESPEALLTRLDINRTYHSWGFFVYLINHMGPEWFERNWHNYLDRESAEADV